MAEVIWQDAAQQHVRSIHSYFYHHATPAIAAKLVRDIIKAAAQLADYPESAPIDADFEDMGNYRGLLVRHVGTKPQFKIMYLYENNKCQILAIWNTKRDSSDKIKVVLQGYSN